MKTKKVLAAKVAAATSNSVRPMPVQEFRRFVARWTRPLVSELLGYPESTVKRNETGYKGYTTQPVAARVSAFIEKCRLTANEFA